MEELEKTIHHYFVDEAGDLTLFDKRGRRIIGNAGVSKYFMVGVALIPNPSFVSTELEKLRSSILSDPYFKNVPSLQVSRKKTAVCFHAKDDLPEIRREVFKLFPSFKTKILVAIRRKKSVADIAELTFSLLRQKLNTNQIYDDLVKRLFKNLLHKADTNEITFARRGKSVREEALRQAIKKAQLNFQQKWNIESSQPINIFPCYPSESAGLQVVDYYLWALQRLFERGEERFFLAIENDYRLIMDLDDTRKKEYGEWYSDSNPLRTEKIMPDVG
jgi:hypothetical protein